MKKEKLPPSIESVKQMHEERLMQLPNVTGVGIGEKSGEKVIEVLVTRKVPEALLKPQERVDKILEGYRTVVQEIGEIEAQ